MSWFLFLILLLPSSENFENLIILEIGALKKKNACYQPERNICEEYYFLAKKSFKILFSLNYISIL